MYQKRGRQAGPCLTLLAGSRSSLTYWPQPPKLCRLSQLWFLNLQGGAGPLPPASLFLGGWWPEELGLMVIAPLWGSRLGWGTAQLYAIYLFIPLGVGLG